MTNRFVDFSGGNNSNDGSSFANRVKTIDSSGMTAARHAAGDTIKMMKSPDPTTLSSTATWTNASRTITLGAAVTKTFDNGSTWTKSANVTGTTGTGKISSSTNLIIAAGFTTGLVAYKDLGSTQDFSAYQQLSLWIKPTISIAAGVLRFDLCSDTLGATPVSQITIDKALAASTWNAIVVDLGSAMSSTVRTFALYAVSDPGTVTLDLNNMIASKGPTDADCLTLYSLLSKQSAPSGAYGWYAPASISGTAVVYDDGINSAANTARTYEGTTETVTTYVRQCIPVDASSGTLCSLQLSGTDGSRIDYSGGWNTTDMTTQTGETWVIDYCAGASGFNFGARSFITLSKFGCVGSGNGFTGNAANNNTITSCWAIGASNNGITLTSGSGWLIDTCGFFNCVSTSATHVSGVLYRNVWKNCTIVGGGSTGIGCLASDFLVGCIIRNCNGTAISYTAGGRGREYQLDTCQTALNATSAISFSGVSIACIHAINCTFSDSTVFSPLPTAGSETWVYSQNNGNVSGAHLITGSGMTISGQTTTRHTASGIAWKISPTDTAWNQYNPIRFKVADVYLAAGAAATITLWVQRDNTDQTIKLVAPALANIVTTEQSASITAAINTWEQLSISVTPGVDGVVPIYVHAYINASGGTTHNSYFDDFSVSQ